jgi:ParB-like chromosome segregation protein Spo0J
MTTPTLEAHPFSKLFPPISDDDFKALVADIKANGLHNHIIRYQGKILDGNNRYRACSLAGVEPTFADFSGDDSKAKAFVISANIHRRHLSRDQRKQIVEMLLVLDPTKSNRQIAEEAKVSHHTVEPVRAELEATGQIAQLGSTKGADGKTRKRQGKPKGKSGAGKKQTITFQEVVNAKTALNAYGVLEEHLLDALQDVADKSDFSQADDLAQRTIEKLQEKLSEMQPEAVEAA